MAGKILDIDKYLTSDRLKSRITRIGVELEGGWEKVPDGTNLEHDGSVQIKVAPGVKIAKGEIPSPPKIPIAMWPWIRKYYPSHVNDTCGFHVHMSFENIKYYQMLMVEDYQDTLIEYLKRWAKEEGLPENHSIWSRLRGENRYCTLKFWPDKQARATSKSHNMERDGHRYTAVNYCFAKDGCQTVEIRVLPMFERPDQAIRAAQRILDITNACLVAMAKKEAKVQENFILDKDDGPYVEHSLEYIR